MEPDAHDRRWRQVQQLCLVVLEQAAADRCAWLEQACEGDDELRAEVESLIFFEMQSGSFLETPALELAAACVARSHVTAVPGGAISHYQVTAPLGSGGMGEVLLARDIRLGRQVALKLLPDIFSDQTERRQQFEREARVASALNHPNIVTIHEIGVAAGRHFIAMEFVQGVTLRQRMTRGTLPLNEQVEISVQVASALAAAHRAGIVHWDIKPENIMLRDDGFVKVLDFGLATLLSPQPGETAASIINQPFVMGTPRYMSPERIRGMPGDAQSDLWSLGVVMFEMMTGLPLFCGKTPDEVVASVLHDEPPVLSRQLPAASRQLEAIVAKAISRQRQHRYSGADAMLTDLRELKDQVEFERRFHPAQTGRSADAPLGSREDGPMTGAVKAGHRMGRAKVAMTVLCAALLILLALAWDSTTGRTAPPSLMAKDTILLTDFDNRTGDVDVEDTVEEALAVQLEQSPFMNVYPQERVREALRLMRRSPDDRVTREVGLEICERHGLKALLTGSIRRFGGGYVIYLEAIQARSGDVIARAQAEVAGKERLLVTLGRASASLRRKLGESISAIERSNDPIRPVTTTSLEAFKAYVQGLRHARAGRSAEAIPLFARAVALDPGFARAHADLSVAYRNTGQRGLARDAAETGFRLIGSVSERERFDLASRHYLATGQFNRAFDLANVWTQTYPSQATPHNILAFLYAQTGQPERVIGEARAATLLDPGFSAPHALWGHALKHLGRFDEARQVFDAAIRQGMDQPLLHWGLFEIAYIRKDDEGVRAHLSWAESRRPRGAADWEAEAAAASGQWQRARRLLGFPGPSAAPAVRQAAAAMPPSWMLKAASLAICGEPASGQDSESVSAGLAHALCGRTALAQSIVDELARIHPQHTLHHGADIPIIRAAIALKQGKPTQALSRLEATRAFELAPAGFLWPLYLRGSAFLALRKGSEAAAEFRRLIDRPGHDPLSPLHPLAHLGLARAEALAGDWGRSRAAYSRFLELWEDADRELRPVREARRELAALPDPTGATRRPGSSTERTRSRDRYGF